MDTSHLNPLIRKLESITDLSLAERKAILDLPLTVKTSSPIGISSATESGLPRAASSLMALSAVTSSSRVAGGRSCRFILPVTFPTCRAST